MDNYRIGDIEFKSESSHNDTYSLIRWKKTKPPSSDSSYCIYLAFFDKLHDGYNIEAVADRLLTAIEECPETVSVWRYAEDFLKLQTKAEQRKQLFEKHSES